MTQQELELPKGWVEAKLDDVVTRIFNGTTEKQTKEKVTLAIEYARYWNATIRVVSVLLKDREEIKDKGFEKIIKKYNAKVDYTQSKLKW